MKRHAWWIMATALWLAACGGGGGGGGGEGVTLLKDGGTETGPQTDASGDTGDADTGPALGACEFAGDGVCDEPANCKLGTDEPDCTRACKNADDIAAFGAACHHRGLAESTVKTGYGNPKPSNGDAHLTGWRDAHMELPNGYDTSQNVQRHFRVYVPESYDPEQAYPLMINMAGHRVSHWVLPGYTGLHRTAEANDFIVIFAGQQFRFGRTNSGKYVGWWAWWTEWGGSSLSNAGPCQQRTPTSNPDYEFIRKLVDWAAADYNIDRRRIYLSGHSRGAAMAFMAALQMPDLIAGAGVQSGFTECGWLNEQLAADTNWEGRKVPFFFFHGTADPDVCINCAGGGQRCAANPNRGCSRGLHATDAIVGRLKQLGWKPFEHYNYFRLDRVAHRWQPQLNQQMWNFLARRPLPAEN